MNLACFELTTENTVKVSVSLLIKLSFHILTFSPLFTTLGLGFRRLLSVRAQGRSQEVTEQRQGVEAADDWPL